MSKRSEMAAKIRALFWDYQTAPPKPKPQQQPPRQKNSSTFTN
jgi:hypothetical protein